MNKSKIFYGSLFFALCFISLYLFTRLANSYDTTMQLQVDVEQLCTQAIATYLEETTEEYVPNYIQPMHDYVAWHWDRDKHQLQVNDIIECSEGNGMSMEPTIFSGHLVCYQAFTGTHVNVGDILQYTSGDGVLTVHRVRAVYQDRAGKQILMQGDGLGIDSTEYISISQIKAKAVAVIYI